VLDARYAAIAHVSDATKHLGTDSTITVANLNYLLRYGAANKSWQPCIFLIEDQVGKAVYSAGNDIANVDGTDMRLIFELPIPTVLNSLKLYCTDFRIDISDADVNNYLTQTEICGIVYDSLTVVKSDPTN